MVYSFLPGQELHVVPRPSTGVGPSQMIPVTSPVTDEIARL
jgi:hypothetical protein